MYAKEFFNLQKSFERLENMDLDKPRLRSSLSAKEKRQLKKIAKERKKNDVE